MADNKMLIDATHPEETRVVVLRAGRVEEFDYESAARKLLRGNIYLAKVTRVEPALQAAFVDYGGNRHGFLAFNEIHPDYYQIPMADRLELIQEEAAAAIEADDEEAAANAQARTYAEDSDEDLNDNGGNGEDGIENTLANVDIEQDAPAENPTENKNSDTDDRDTMITSADGAQDGIAESDPASNEPQHAPPPETDDQTRSKVIGEATAKDPSISEAIKSAPDATDASKRDPQDSDEPGQSSLEEETQESGSSQNTTGPESEIETTGTPDEPTPDKDIDNDVDAPSHIGLVEDERVEDVDLENETTEDDTVEETGSEDALEELPSRPRRSLRSYKIQEVIKRRQILLVQVVKEERGNKGAALTTYLSLAGRYTVLMPNTARGGGVSRKISSPQDRKRMKAIAADLDVPEGMGLIIRTAGASRTKQEIRRDFEYLLRLWESVRELTLESTAPSLVYEEGNLIKRSIRDLYNKDVGEILVAGERAYKDAKSFMRMLMPSHTRNVTLYKAPEPLFTKFQIERQLNAMFSPQVSLKSGGYLVINQTEALVAIDVNSGRSTREFSIEETALHTNLEAADEIARQLKLRDLAGLIVIDFIDMDDRRNNRAVERRMKEALRDDRARIQVGRISHFGLMEMSRQRMRTGVLEGSTSQCAHCQGTGIVRSTESVALAVLRGLEDAVILGSRTPLVAQTASDVALYILNSKREFIDNMESRLGQSISIEISDKMVGANFKIEKSPAASRTSASRQPRTAVNMNWGFDEGENGARSSNAQTRQQEAGGEGNGGDDEQPRRRRRRRRERRPGEDIRSRRQGSTADAANNDNISFDNAPEENAGAGETMSNSSENARPDDTTGEDEQPRRSRRRGRRGGRRNRERREQRSESVATDQEENIISGDEPASQNGFGTQNPDDNPSLSDAPPVSEMPGMGPQPEQSSPSSEHKTTSPSDQSIEPDSDEKPAKSPRRRRTGTTRTRARARSRTSSKTQKSDPEEDSPALDKTGSTEPSQSQSDEEPRESVKTSKSRRSQEPSITKIEIKSIQLGETPSGAIQEDGEKPSHDPKGTKKPARTGWWQRRLLGEEE